MCLVLPPFDILDVILRELSIPSDEILRASERGDLIDSLLGCLVSDSGMHFECIVLVSSLSSSKSNC